MASLWSFVGLALSPPAPPSDSAESSDRPPPADEAAAVRAGEAAGALAARYEEDAARFAFEMAARCPLREGVPYRLLAAPSTRARCVAAR